MRTMCVAVLLISTTAAATAQSQTTTTSSSTTTDQAGLADGLFSEPRVLRRGVEFAGRWENDSESPVKDGFYPDLVGPITGAGWISVGPGYRKHFADRQILVDGSAEISWRAYKQAEARIELPRLAGEHLTVGSQVRWQDFTQISYFGIGPDSLDSLRSEYRLKDTDVLGYGNLRPNRWLSVGGRFGWLRHPTLDSSSGPFDRDFPSTLNEFPLDPGVIGQPDFLHGDVSVGIDTRNEHSHPTGGGYYRATAAAYSARDLNQFSFRRYDAEGLQLLPVMGKNWVVALHGWGVFSDTSSGNEVPLYFLPSLGGGNTLRGYHDYRFHDRNLLLASVESRWAIFRHVDAVAFADAGSVAARAGDLTLDKRSYGAGVRVHTGTSTLGRFDIGHSDEGWHLWFRLDDPFRLARRSERRHVVPFVP
jgi:Omp85 superfamily domain